MKAILRQPERDLPADKGCGPVSLDRDTQSEPLRLQVFEYIRAHGNAARADIARALSISAGSVTGIAADLIDAGLLQEVEVARLREHGRGRPPVALEVVADFRHVIGIKLSDDRHSAVVTDFAGNKVADATLRTASPRKSLRKMVDEIASLIAALLGECQMAPQEISAIGVGISGVVDHQTGTVIWSPLLTETDADLAAAVSARFGCPTACDNDVNTLTLAELWFGEGREKSNFAVVTVEHGVGMGLVLNNQLYRGSSNKGLELGHTKVRLDGALCRCGQRGCLEAYLADYALVREAATALGQTSFPNVDVALEILFTEARSGNQAAQTIFKRAGRYLAVGLANVVQLFDPALIILSGERMRFDYLYSDDVLAQMRSLTLNTQGDDCQVVTHAWGDLIWARGASVLALTAVTRSLVGV